MKKGTDPRLEQNETEKHGKFGAGYMLSLQDRVEKTPKQKMALQKCLKEKRRFLSFQIAHITA